MSEAIICFFLKKLMTDSYFFMTSLLDGEPMQLFLNVGGPDRLSRLEMAKSVATYRGYDLSLIKSVSASSVSLKLGTTANLYIMSTSKVSFSLYLYFHFEFLTIVCIYFFGIVPCSSYTIGMHPSDFMHYLLFYF